VVRRRPTLRGLRQGGILGVVMRIVLLILVVALVAITATTSVALWIYAEIVTIYERRRHRWRP
jgi:hypothetical protein